MDPETAIVMTTMEGDVVMEAEINFNGTVT